MTCRLSRIGLAVLLSMFTSACQREPQPSPAAGPTPTSAAPAEKEAETELVVDGMHCETCPFTVRTAARSVAGVIDARVSMESGRAWVRYRPSLATPAAIAAAITRSGYPAREPPK
ncbi:MAG: heavy-metal-associated domain-containing protein [Deltaproteobacteria bacterium]|nr:heavy-metal-associated domain-containing protein [Deltaproteobacteria bacterium]